MFVYVIEQSQNPGQQVHRGLLDMLVEGFTVRQGSGKVAPRSAYPKHIEKVAPGSVYPQHMVLVGGRRDKFNICTKFIGGQNQNIY